LTPYIQASACITGCLFENNHADGYGGAIYSSLASYTQGNLTVDSCVFRANSAMQGGAVYAGANFNSISNSTFESNYADKGADLYTSSKLQVIGCAFVGGTSNYHSGFYCDSGQVEIIESVLCNLSPVTTLSFLFLMFLSN